MIEKYGADPETQMVDSEVDYNKAA